MKKTLLIRHGESVSNLGEATTGKDSAILSTTGYMQARKLAERFDKKPDLIVVSPYVRTMQTAMPLIQKFPDVPVETWDVHEFALLSHELYNGATSAQKEPWIKKYIEKNDTDFVYGDGAESFNQLMTRVDGMLKKIDRSKFTVIFTHHDFINAALMRLNKLPITVKTFADMKSINNTEIVEI